MLNNLKRKILTSIIFGALIYLGLSIYADAESVVESFNLIDWWLIPILLFLSYLNYFTRFIKWDYYLSLLGVKISKRDSFEIFMSGLIMSVTPGKVGELLKSYMVKEISGDSISKTAPIVLAERITDFLSLLLIGIVGALMFNYGQLIVFGTLIFFVLLVYFLASERFAGWVLKFLARIKFLNKFIGSISEAYNSASAMLQPVPLFKMFLLSFVSWFFECFGFYLILVKFSAEITVMWSSFVYAFSTILGSITMMPGGLGVTDGSLTYFLVEHGFLKNHAVAATFLVRVVTLWFAVLVGIISLSMFQKRYGKIRMGEEG